MMKNNPFKLTYYFGLLMLFIPIFFVILIIFFTFVSNSSKEKNKKEIVVEKQKVIVYDTIVIEKTRPKSIKPFLPKIQITETNNIDSEKTLTDTLNP